jgi:hypothetical protein
MSVHIAIESDARGEERRAKESRGEADTAKVVGPVDESDVYDGNISFYSDSVVDDNDNVRLESRDRISVSGVCMFL